MQIADLHIHSRYSRATSKECIPEYLELWARKKGITILGTGDFTHPAWREELKEKLEQKEEGMYVLKEKYRLKGNTAGEEFRPRFVVSGEISSIYKKNGKVRKIHNLILLPGIKEAELLSHRLEAIGNLHSDGRPILGLDSRDLLEITLEICPNAVFIPAHIWTPHFSLFGAFSGFDSIEECFEDLTPHIHALETGLSSDPPMNFRISALDSYHLISNSDAHSPSKLGREGNLFDIPFSYSRLEQAIRTGDGLSGTIEFFPEEGKYHYDGHRKCGLCLTPAEAEAYAGICPVCGKKLTIGVQHRVEQLSDRALGDIPQGKKPFESLVPLPEVIAAATGRAAAGKQTAAEYEKMLHHLGTEFEILRTVPFEKIGSISGPYIEEGIRRLREGRVEKIPGYDGEYGKIHVISKADLETLYGQMSFLTPLEQNPETGKKRRKPLAMTAEQKEAREEKETEPEKPLLLQLNEEQNRAVRTKAKTVAVIAGPGTGKTKTLTAKIISLIQEEKVKPGEITAVTFTRKAAQEIKERVNREIGDKRRLRGITIGTFHGICNTLLKEWKEDAVLIEEWEQENLAKETINECALSISPKKFLEQLTRKKNGAANMQEESLEDAFIRYEEKKTEQGLMDFDDLLLRVIAHGKEGEFRKSKALNRFHYLLIDEFQDSAPVSYELIHSLLQEDGQLFVIGDPDQSIYGFRGADAGCFQRLAAERPDTKEIRLVKNYRSTPEILHCAKSVIGGCGGEESLYPQSESGKKVRLITAEGSMPEAIFIAKEVSRMIGGTDMLGAQEIRLKGKEKVRSLSDIAILYRTHRQAKLIEKCLIQEGIPCITAGKEDIFQDGGVKEAISFFEYLCEPENPRRLKRCLNTAFGFSGEEIAEFMQIWKKEENRQFQVHKKFDNAWKTLSSYGKTVKRTRPGKLLETWRKDRGGEKSRAFESLLNMAVFEKDMTDFLENLSFGAEGDCMRASGKNYRKDAVRLFTLHGSKGLEFPVVFIAGIEKGLLPYEQKGNETEKQEERRLLYVGMTRAKEELLLLSGKEPSEFLLDLPWDFMECTELKKRKKEAVQMSLFDFME